MKTFKWLPLISLSAFLLCSIQAWAGGVHCAPGYCIDNDANGCHPCDAKAVGFLIAGCGPPQCTFPTTPPGPYETCIQKCYEEGHSEENCGRQCDHLAAD